MLTDWIEVHWLLPVDRFIGDHPGYLRSVTGSVALLCVFAVFASVCVGEGVIDALRRA